SSERNNFLSGPGRKRVHCQGAVVVGSLTSHLWSGPRWQDNTLVLVSKLNFGDDKAGVLAGKHVNLPRIGQVRNDVAVLFNDAALAKRHDGLRPSSVIEKDRYIVPHFAHTDRKSTR